MESKEKSLAQMKTGSEKSRHIQVVVSDMDGSFLNRRGEVSPANARAVRQLSEAGIRFMVCTGRSREEAMVPLKEAGISCDMIAMNGAAVYGRDGTVREEYFLSESQLCDVIRIVDAEEARKNLILQFVTDRGEFILAEEAVFRHFFLTRIFGRAEEEGNEELLAGYIRTTPEEFLRLGACCYKAVVLSEDTEQIRQIKPKLLEISGVCVAASFPTNWEITHEKASKGQGLSACAALLGYSLEQVMAFGDGDNDQTMLSLPLGWSVAMGNACDGLKAAADVVTLSNEEDGFAAAVEALLDGRKN